MAARLAQHWFLLLLLGGLALALGLPHHFRAATEPLDPRLIVATSLFLTAWTMPGRSLAGELARPLPSLWAVLISYGAVPGLAWLLGALTTSPDLAVGLLLVSCVPCTLASAVLWTRLAGGNEATALLTVLGTTLLSWLCTTAWLTAATGTAVALAVGPLMLDLVACLVLPVVLGQLGRLPPGAAALAHRSRAPAGAVAQMLVLAIVLKAGVTVGLKLEEGAAALGPAVLLGGLVLAVGLHLFALAFGFFSGGWLGFDRGRCIGIAFSCSQKTLPVSLLLFDEYYKTAYPLAVVPLLCYHAGQLLLDTLIAQRLVKKRMEPQMHTDEEQTRQARG